MADTKLSALASATGIGPTDQLYLNSGGTSKKVTNITVADGASVSGSNTGDQTLPTRSSLGLDTSDSPQFAGIELGHASDTTISRTGAGAIAVEGTAVLLSGGALGTPASGTLTNCSGLPVSGVTGDQATALAVGTIELGHASDTTISRTGAGAIAVEGTAVLLSGGALGTPASGTLTNCTGLPASGLSSGTLAEDVLISLDTTLSADGKYCGFGQSGTAGAVLAFGDVVYYAAADSKWEKTDADAAATAGPVKLAICTAAAAEDASVALMFRGVIREDDWNWTTIGAPVYLDTATAGGMTQTPPSGSGDIVRIVGYAKTADSIWFEPDTSYVEIA